MIEETVTYSCRSCGSEHIIRNGHNKCGNPQYLCKDCGACRVLTPKVRYTAEDQAVILNAYRERMSLRGLQRVFGVWRATVLRWLEQRLQALPTLTESLLPAQVEDVLEMDELVTFVSEKWFKRWLWTAQCRRTRQIVAFVIGDRSETTAQKLWQAIPEGYRTCPVFTDLFNVYPLIVPPEQHHPCRKRRGKLIIKSAGTTPCASGSDATPAAHCPSPKKIATMNSSLAGLFCNTIYSFNRHHVPSIHYRLNEWSYRE